MSIKAIDIQEDIKVFPIDAIRISPGDWKGTVISCPGLEDEIVNTLHKKPMECTDSLPQPIVRSYAELALGFMSKTPNGRTPRTIMCG